MSMRAETGSASTFVMGYVLWMAVLVGGWALLDLYHAVQVREAVQMALEASADGAATQFDRQAWVYGHTGVPANVQGTFWSLLQRNLGLDATGQPLNPSGPIVGSVHASLLVQATGTGYSFTAAADVPVRLLFTKQTMHCTTKYVVSARVWSPGG